MKVILQKDVKGLGRAHEEIETSDGHALNFLIPKHLAISATRGASKTAEGRRASVKHRTETGVKLIEERLAYLAENTLTVSRKANEQGHLYDALDGKDLALLAEVAPEAVRLEKPIKELGTHLVPVAFGDQMGSFTVVVEAE